jgi:hypothetical protein
MDKVQIDYYKDYENKFRDDELELLRVMKMSKLHQAHKDVESPEL